MSEKSGHGHGRFIPTLTEVIEDADVLNQVNQGVVPQSGKASNAVTSAEKSSKNSAPAQPVKNKQQEQSATAFFQGWSLSSKTATVDAFASSAQMPATPSVQKSEPEVVTSGSVFVGQPFHTQPASSHGAQKTAPDDVALPQDEELLHENQEIFSSLSRSPAAAQDSLRPSDLMLVALSERIAGKARLRMEKNIEAHIEAQIFPLLDQFSAQLVEHIQDDLVKIMRESIAEATREELDWLRQKGNKARS